jgi:hypothetical protein
MLNTEDTAKVVKIQPAYPLRPVVQVWYDAHGNLYDEKKTIDLNKNTTIYIKKALAIK